MEKVFRIYEGNLEHVMKKMARIENKCRKYGVEFTCEEVGEEFVEEHVDGRDTTVRFVLVKASGTAVINGWEFVSTLTRAGNENVLHSVADIELPERFYACKPECEHCKTRRARKETYVVHNVETDEFKQVGSSCLNDFTHGLSAEAFGAFWDGVIALEDGGIIGAGSNYKLYYNVRKFLACVAETISYCGYVKSDDADCTRDKASECYLIRAKYYANDRGPKHIKKFMEEVGFNPDRQNEYVEQVLEWLSKQEASNNYMHNLKAICSTEYTEARNIGILASLFVAYDRTIERERKIENEKKAEELSEYVGEINSRVSATIVSAKAVTGWETQFGYTSVYKFVDENNNVYTWKTTKYLDCDRIKSITGTVKAHTEYRGTKQTELTRCRVA